MKLTRADRKRARKVAKLLDMKLEPWQEEMFALILAMPSSAAEWKLPPAPVRRHL